MSNTVIKVDNLSKRYIIGHQSQDRYQYKTLRDQLTLGAKRFGKRLLHPLKASSGQPLLGVDESEEFWALKDVSFEVKQGDRIGIIGRNGAGKSTLLKILSRITEPTTGRAQIKGRVASLLEIGTGFHPELTGRENIFLNGAVLGMSRQDIRKKFDEIIAFAEIEKFLDTPVKRYSSGMYVRLAFAVAAHLEPEILIVDEVLAVGDAEFQNKCLGKMDEVSKKGRTILFVSHNMGALKKLCPHSILLTNGKLSAYGPCERIISKYLDTGELGILEKKWPCGKEPGNRFVKLLSTKAFQKNQTSPYIFDSNKEISVEFVIKFLKGYKEFSLAAQLISLDGTTILHTASIISDGYSSPEIGINKFILKIPQNLLKSGKYLLNIGADIPNVEIVFLEDRVLTWEVAFSQGQLDRYSNETWKGYLNPKIVEWEFQIC